MKIKIIIVDKCRRSMTPKIRMTVREEITRIERKDGKQHMINGKDTVKIREESKPCLLRWK